MVGGNKSGSGSVGIFPHAATQTSFRIIHCCGPSNAVNQPHLLNATFEAYSHPM